DYTLGRAVFLGSTHLPGDRSADDVVPRKVRPFTRPWEPITELEVDKAILHSKNTAPGEDEISPGALKMEWAVVRGVVVRLYRLCLENGWHPRTFRTARLCPIKKPGKRD